MTSSEEVFTCDITALATGGDGLGRVDGREAIRAASP